MLELCLFFAHVNCLIDCNCILLLRILPLDNTSLGHLLNSCFECIKLPHDHLCGWLLVWNISKRRNVYNKEKNFKLKCKKSFFNCKSRVLKLNKDLILTKVR